MDFTMSKLPQTWGNQSIKFNQIVHLYGAY